MCGIAGALSTWLSGPEIETFKTLMKLSIVRGEDGAGVAAVNLKQKVLINRTLWTAYDLVVSDEFKKLHEHQKCAFIGHARWPTRGKVDEIDMVHPHRCGHIVGVHNGTLSSLNGTRILAGESDSKLLFDSFAKNGVKETIKKIDGAYALVWVDEQEKTINFLRNHERPLFFGYHDYSGQGKPQTLYFASDDRFLDIALRRGADPDLKIQPLAIHQWMKFPLKVSNPVVPISMEELKPDPKPVLSNYYGYGANSRSWKSDTFWEEVEFDTKPKAALPAPNRLGKKKEDEPSSSFFQNLFREDSPENRGTNLEQTSKGHYVSKKVYASYLDKGCVYCGRIPDVKEVDDNALSWVSTNQYLCLDCSTDPSLPNHIH